MRPQYVDWKEGDPVLPGYRPTTQTRQGLLVGGALSVGTPYVIGILTAVFGGVSRSGTTLLLPVAGPFLCLSSCRPDSTGITLLVLDGIGQTGGVAMFIAGLAARKSVLVRDETSKLRLVPTPMTFGRSSAGFGITGTF